MKLLVALAPLAALVFAAGCSSDESNPGTPTQTTTYTWAPPFSIGAVPTVVATRLVTAPPTPAPPPSALASVAPPASASSEAPALAAPPAPSARAAPAPPRAARCNPPYTIDALGDKHYKRECLQ